MKASRPLYATAIDNHSMDAQKRQKGRRLVNPSRRPTALLVIVAALVLANRNGGSTSWYSPNQGSSASTASIKWMVQALSTTPVSTLLSQHQATIAKLKSICTERSVDLASMPFNNDVFFLRYCLSEKKATTTDDSTPETLLNQSLDWRLSDTGRRIATVAAMAVEQATTSSTKSSKWNNDVVLQNAPHSTAITSYITPQNCITTTTLATPTTTPNLVYCIRAGSINDVALLKAVSVNQLVEFFLYVKEVNALVCDMRSRTSDQLLYTITCNDLSGVKLIGGSADFRQALSASSKLAATIYPSSYTGPTLLLNLPTLLAALVQLFTPLFPESVKARLKFSQGLLQNVNDLTLIATTSTSSERMQFVNALEDILQGNTK